MMEILVLCCLLSICLSAVSLAKLAKNTVEIATLKGSHREHDIRITILENQHGLAGPIRSREG